RRRQVPVPKKKRQKGKNFQDRTRKLNEESSVGPEKKNSCDSSPKIGIGRLRTLEIKKIQYSGYGSWTLVSTKQR
ncbi:MAG: hypothetical protein ACK56F_16235, partial [bacterium]